MLPTRVEDEIFGVAAQLDSSVRVSFAEVEDGRMGRQMARAVLWNSELTSHRITVAFRSCTLTPRTTLYFSSPTHSYFHIATSLTIKVHVNIPSIHTIIAFVIFFLINFIFL